jgi:hypothetical protein
LALLSVSSFHLFIIELFISYTIWFHFTYIYNVAFLFFYYLFILRMYLISFPVCFYFKYLLYSRPLALVPDSTSYIMIAFFLNSPMSFYFTHIGMFFLRMIGLWSKLIDGSL